MLLQQTWSCKALICVWQYFILANYSWLLMEGLYLHSLIFMALFTDSSAITLYIMLGWGESTTKHFGNIATYNVDFNLYPSTPKPLPSYY